MTATFKRTVRAKVKHSLDGLRYELIRINDQLCIEIWHKVEQTGWLYYPGDMGYGRMKRRAEELGCIVPKRTHA